MAFWPVFGRSHCHTCHVWWFNSMIVALSTFQHMWNYFNQREHLMRGHDGLNCLITPWNRQFWGIPRRWWTANTHSSSGSFIIYRHTISLCLVFLENKTVSVVVKFSSIKFSCVLLSLFLLLISTLTNQKVNKLEMIHDRRVSARARL